MSNDNKTLADVQPGGRVRLGDQASAQGCDELRMRTDGERAAYLEGVAEGRRAVLSAQPSPGGQEVLETVEELAELNRTCAALDPDYKGPTDAAVQAVITALAARQPVVVDLPESLHDRVEALREVAARQPVGVSTDTLRALADRWASDRGYTGSPVDEIRALIDEPTAASQPVGELHLPPDGFYKIVFDDAEVPDESFARSGALDAALRRFEQISNKWNAHLFVRFANNTRDCTVPNATTAQAVDLDALRRLSDGWLARSEKLSVTQQRKAGAYWACAKELRDWLDSQAVGNG